MASQPRALRAPEAPKAAEQADSELWQGSGRGSMQLSPGQASADMPAEPLEPSTARAAQMLSEFFDVRGTAGAKSVEDEKENKEPVHWKQQSALAVQAMGMNEPARSGRDSRLSALAGDDAAGLRTWGGEAEGKSSRRAPLGTHLLPQRYNKWATQGPGLSLMWGIAAKPINTFQLGPDCPEDSRHRVLVTKSTPAVLLLELNAVATFNMMDPDTSQDILFGMDAVVQLMKMPKALKNKPLSYVIQGSGPHFCPGGNPNPKLYPGHIAMTVNQFAGYLPFIRCREMGLPGLTALHGSLVGGGVAYSLNNPIRYADNKASACFGNLSRGAVPGMVLSRNIPQALGMIGAVDIYLTDSTYSSYACVKAGYLEGVQASIQATKQEALKQARRLAESPFAHRLVGIKPELDVDRFGVEGWCIDLAGRVEGVFKNVGGKGPALKEAEPDKDAAKAPGKEEGAKAHQEDWNEWRLRQAKPKKRPKRRPRRAPPAGAVG